MFLYHCISEGRLSLENVRCHFHFILHVINHMPDKAAFVSSALLCVMYSLTAVTGETSSSPALKRLLLAEKEFTLLISPSDLHSKHILLVIKK